MQRWGPRFPSDDFYRAVYGVTYGELLGLIELLEQHAEPITYDCLRAGVHLRELGTDRFSWDELLAIIRQSDMNTALYRAMHTDDWYWTPSMMLLADAVDSLRIQVWQLSGGKKKDFPKPIPRPGVKDANENRYGSKAISMDEMSEWLGWA